MSEIYNIIDKKKLDVVSKTIEKSHSKNIQIDDYQKGIYIDT